MTQVDLGDNPIVETSENFTMCNNCFTHHSSKLTKCPFPIEISSTFSNEDATKPLNNLRDKLETHNIETVLIGPKNEPARDINGIAFDDIPLDTTAFDKEQPSEHEMSSNTQFFSSLLNNNPDEIIFRLKKRSTENWSALRWLAQLLYYLQSISFPCGYATTFLFFVLFLVSIIFPWFLSFVTCLQFSAVFVIYYMFF